MRACAWFVVVAVAGLLASTAGLRADGSGDPAPASSDDGKYLDKAGNPTFRIAPDGTVDWYTSIGYIRYTANCLQCHGPDGLGSSFAPSLVDALKTIDYGRFIDIVTNGKKNVDTSQELVMPSFGDNPNVMCYIDAIFVYLRARSDGALGRGRPQKNDPRPPGYSATEDACMG
ncbi:c-type cytochrome, methanol metabolism-related [Ancylobacter oerskovii]|uniref:C-type cytochrome, methanol metabolism-related n=1 Tax=Ancylobacter oerskovii TaxID=459519 RepID=A0ABW4YVT1_9HYPH|nr:c-type cytochrome, methanol metabolism-related [Ancylobacter oerskovii]MBS7543192.1 c-type cytochrome, methanol metabolism-related [Ancylobacter oerskovii]